MRFLKASIKKCGFELIGEDLTQTFFPLPEVINLNQPL